MLSFKIHYLDIPESDAVTTAIRKRILKLERFFNRIVRCDVTVACPHHHRRNDRLYNIKVCIMLPKDDVIVSHSHCDDESHRDVKAAIRDTFDAAERILQDKARLLRGDVKRHSLPQGMGLV